MPEEFSRTTARKKVLLPSGEFVYIPVITKISFIDPFQQYQEWEYSIDNSLESGRIVHIDQVPSSSDDEVTGEEISVERIDKWPHTDAYDRHQETQMQFDNITGSDQIPPHFSTHLQTHVVRYKSEDDENIWVESELIDSFSVIDPFDRYQEKIFTLNNPQNDDEAQADPNDPDITNGDGNGEGTDPDNPVRTDPFQNIVNFAGEAPEFFMRWDYATDFATVTHVEGDGHVDTGVVITHYPDTPPPSSPIIDPTLAVSNSRTTGWTLSIQSFAIARPSNTSLIITGPGPIVTLSVTTETFDDWQYFYWNNGGVPVVHIWQPPNGSVSGGEVVTGSPLLNEQGHPIQDVIDTLQANWKNYLVAVDGPHPYSRASNPINDHPDPATWINYQTGTYSGIDTLVSSQIATVSSAPFTFDGKTYQARGLYPISSSVAFNQVYIYCVRIE